MGQNDAQLSCSGHGTVVDGKCKCNAGWTGVGDFNPIPDLDCCVSEVAVKTMAIISIILGAFCMLQYLTFILRRRYILQAKFAKKDLFAMTYFVQTLTANIYVLILIIQPSEATFGYSIFATVLIWIAYLTAYGGSIVFFEAVMVLLMGITKVLSPIAQQKMKDSVGVFTSRTRYLYILCFLCSLNGLTGLCLPPDKCKTTGIVWFYCWDVFMVLFMFTFNPPVSLLRSELKLADNFASSTTGLRGVCFRLTLVQITLNFVFVLTTIFFTLWASIDALMRMSVYLTL